MSDQRRVRQPFADPIARREQGIRAAFPTPSPSPLAGDQSPELG
jgi:hypothetical protein